MTPLTNNQFIKLAEAEGAIICTTLDRETNKKDSIKLIAYISDEGDDYVCVELTDMRNFTIQRNDEPFFFSDEDFDIQMFSE